MTLRRKEILVYAVLLLLAFSFRFSLARFFPNDEPNDGKLYAQIARNVLELHVYSHATEPPYDPSLIRLPGYPLLLAAVYSGFGHYNNTAVRVFQAVIDTATCGLIALVAFLWEPDAKRKRRAAVAALALATLCPFTAIYVATILTETPTIFFAVAMTLTATFAFQAKSGRQSIIFWSVTGVIAGIAVLFRPDSGLFAAAIGVTLVITTFLRPSTGRKEIGPWRGMARNALPVAYLGVVFSAAFCLVLVPWTIRNERVFHLFQPLAPAHAEMPGEFVPRGYLAWLRTWLDDGRYIDPVLWSLDERPIKIDDFPERAFDSAAEKATVVALLEKYNHPPDSEDPQAGSQAGSSDHSSDAEPSATPEENAADESDETNSDSAGEGDESDLEDQSAATDEQNVEMTPDIDAGFAALARARIARAPLRYYLRLPVKRAMSLWFDTHSQYYPFEGELLPLSDLDHDIKQQYWLPLFAGLTWLYTLLGILGGWFLWRSGQFAARRWLLLAVLMTLVRLAFFSTLENPEPRYVVEIFPFLAILGGIVLARIPSLRRARLFKAKA
ncbi:MAG: glycosyltransferase family 39 protein [Acidobacteriota bacterium]